MGEVPLKTLFIFLLPLEGSDHVLLISYVNQSFMTSSDGMKGLDGLSFVIKAPEGLQPKRFESVLHLTPVLMGCCLLHEKDLNCLDEGHSPNSPKQWLTDEIISFYMFWI